MINPTIEDRLYSSYSNIGAIVCHTPKTLVYSYKDENGDDIFVDHRCELVNSTQQLIDYYGDPFIDPVKYHDLVIAYKLVSRGYYMYISSIDDEMLEDNDDFRISYNGYTEFYFVDKDGFDSVGYKLKSDIKFCQPIIRSKYAINRLDIYVDLYILNRSQIQGIESLRTFNKSNLYKTIHYTFDVSKSTTTDESIIESLLEDGLELHVLNADYTKKTSLIDELKAYKQLVIYFNSYDEYKEAHNEQDDLTKIERNTYSDHYWYRLNSDKYVYDFDDIDKVTQKYTDALLRLSEKKPEPHHLLLSRIYKSVNIKNNDNIIVRSILDDIDDESTLYIQSSLLELFPSECYTFCYLNIPDISSNSAIELLANEDNSSYYLPENYNCDLYYGSISDYVISSLDSQAPYRVYFPLASFVFYSLIHDDKVYSSNSLDGLNISISNAKFLISNSTAVSLRDLRCNSLILSDSSKVAVYGNRSLSLLPNLRYSHIASNFVRLRRLIHEYLETKKFILNTYFNIQNCLNYIRTQILEPYIESGILSNYNISYATEHQTVTIDISLVFARALESLNLNFTI